MAISEVMVHHPRPDEVYDTQNPPTIAIERQRAVLEIDEGRSRKLSVKRKTDLSTVKTILVTCLSEATLIENLSDENKLGDFQKVSGSISLPISDNWFIIPVENDVDRFWILVRHQENPDRSWGRRYH